MVFIILLSNGLLLVHRVTVGFYVDLDLNVVDLSTSGFFFFFREFIGIFLCTGEYHLQIEVVLLPPPHLDALYFFFFLPSCLGRSHWWKSLG